MQEGEKGIDHLFGLLLIKLKESQQNYSISEKEILALLLALQHYDFYIRICQLLNSHLT